MVSDLFFYDYATSPAIRAGGGVRLGRALSQIKLNAQGRYNTYRPGVSLTSYPVALDGTQLGRLGCLHLPGDSVHEQVGGPHVGLVALAHEAHVMARRRESASGLFSLRRELPFGTGPSHTMSTTPIQKCCQLGCERRYPLTKAQLRGSAHVPSLSRATRRVP